MAEPEVFDLNRSYQKSAEYLRKALATSECHSALRAFLPLATRRMDQAAPPDSWYCNVWDASEIAMLAGYAAMVAYPSRITELNRKISMVLLPTEDLPSQGRACRDLLLYVCQVTVDNRSAVGAVHRLTLQTGFDDWQVLCQDEVMEKDIGPPLRFSCAHGTWQLSDQYGYIVKVAWPNKSE